MAKLVEYPAPLTPEQLLEKEWYLHGRLFLFGNFTESELEVSGFNELWVDDDSQEQVEYLIELPSDELACTSPLQALVFYAFDKRIAGAIRHLWIRDIAADVQMRETALLTFPLAVATETKLVLEMAARADWDFFNSFVQCVSTLHAYTRLPSGQLSDEQIAEVRNIIGAGPVGDLLQRIRSTRPR